MDMDLGQAKSGNMENLVDDYSVDAKELDSPDGTIEFSYTNSNFANEMGYMDEVAELGSTIKAMAKWTVGKGFKADKATMEILGNIRGFGKDSFNEIIKNDIKIYMASGDSYCEQIREKTLKDKIQNVGNKISLGLIRYAPGSGKLLNLKPLNAGKIAIVVDGAGMLKRYEYSQGTQPPQIFQPNQIFHLAWDRIGDQIHGTSIIRRLKAIIDARNEAMTDMRVVFHRYVKPLWVWSLNTNNTAKIADFQRKADKLVNTGNNIYIPKGAAEAERVSVPQYSTLDPLPWIDALNSYFYQATNVPDVILGSAKQTVEASAKMLVFAFEQSVQEHQLFLEEQIKLQLGLDVNFEFPASIATDVYSDQAKDGKPKAAKPSDTKAKVEGKK